MLFFSSLDEKILKGVHIRGGIPDRRPTGPVGSPQAGPGWAIILEMMVQTSSGSVTQFLCVSFPFLSVRSWDSCFSDSSDGT